MLLVFYKKLSLKIFNFDPGENFLLQDPKYWLISSCNVKNYSCGHLLEAPAKIIVEGSIPARLIPISLDLKKKINLYQKLDINKSSQEELVIKNTQNNSANKRIHYEALEDWYGRLNKNTSYPLSKGSGPIEESLACLRMISQYFLR